MKISQSHLYLFENKHTLTNHLLKSWVQGARRAIRRSGRFIMAVSARPQTLDFLCQLSGLEEDDIWKKTILVLTDDIASHPRRGELFRLLRENLLDFVPLKDPSLVSFDFKDKSVAQTLEAFAAALRGAGSRDPLKARLFDWTLFDLSDPALFRCHFDGPRPYAVRDHLVQSVLLAEDDVRVGLTLPALCRSTDLFIRCTGAGSSHAVSRLIDGGLLPVNVPARLLCDPSAAQALHPFEEFEHDGFAVRREVGHV